MTEEMDREALLERLQGVNIGDSLPPAPEDDSTDAGEEQPPEAIDAQDDTGSDSGEEQSPDVQEEPDETDSRYEKLRKAEVRQNKAWQKIEAEKAEVRALREELEASKRALDADRLKLAEDLATNDSAQSPEALEKVAERFRDEGEPELAEEAERMAQEAREKQSGAEKTVEVERFKKAWGESVAKEAEANPDLKNPDSALHVKVKELLKERPVLTSYEGGFSDAVEAAKLFLGRDTASALEEENKKLKEELNNLKKRTQLGGNDAAKRPKAKRFEDLPHEEQKKRLLQQLEAADSRR